MGQSIRFRLEAPSTRGWIGFGIDRDAGGMDNSEMFVVESSSGVVTVTHRYATRSFLPPVIGEPLAVLANGTGSNMTGKLVATFDRVKQPPSGSTTVLQISPTQMQNVIFAWGSGPFAFHGSNKLVSRAMLLSSSNAYVQPGSNITNPKPSLPANVTDSPSDLSGLESGAADDWETRYQISHGALMVTAWGAFAPASIIVARYFKSIFGMWWFRIHMALSYAGAFGCTVAGFGIALKVTGPNGHFAVDSALGGTHRILGLVVVVLVGVQLFLGIIIHKLFNPARTSIPWHDKMHWYLGRLVFVAGIANVWTGLVYYSQDALYFLNWWFYMLGAWMVAILLVIGVLEVKLGPGSRMIVGEKQGAGATHLHTV
ncbi:hypothetical protein BJ742DRAFT_818269 [Cladochytrium replicatum]|nr:hypothetical protein BJ742DRAFT_818269 [Cladochytrium replicatum]